MSWGYRYIYTHAIVLYVPPTWSASLSFSGFLGYAGGPGNILGYRYIHML